MSRITAGVTDALDPAKMLLFTAAGMTAGATVINIGDGRGINI
jgi:hypothetical protein